MGLKFSYSQTTPASSTCDSLMKLNRSVTTGDCYGLLIDIADVLRGAGAAGPRSWGVGLVGDKTAGVLTTAGCDDAYLRISGSNYVANEEIYYFRGLNCNVNNRSGGIVGGLENVISVSAKQGSVQSTIKGLNVDAQSLAADTGDEFGGLDVSLNREGGVNTVEYGLQIRTRGTINAAIKTAINIKQGATDYGFTNFVNFATAAACGIATATSFAGTIKKVPVMIEGVQYYLAAYGTVS